MALEKLGDAAGAREELERLVKACQRTSPMETYFAVLALRKLGGREATEQADRWLGDLEHKAKAWANDPTETSQYWCQVMAAMAARARGDRAESNRLLAELTLPPGDELADYLASELY